MKRVFSVGIIMLILIFSLTGCGNKEELNRDNNIQNEWKKINIYDFAYYESTTVSLDLNGDDNNEIVELNDKGEYININNVNYVVNKYISKGCDINQYHILDLNNDGKLEIIHRTFSDMISPSTSKYTIYNFDNDTLIEIGNISIIGNIPNDLYVKGNTIKFKYWPYESPGDYTEEVEYTLDI